MKKKPIIEKKKKPRLPVEHEIVYHSDGSITDTLSAPVEYWKKLPKYKPIYGAPKMARPNGNG